MFASANSTGTAVLVKINLYNQIVSSYFTPLSILLINYLLLIQCLYTVSVFITTLVQVTFYFVWLQVVGSGIKLERNLLFQKRLTCLSCVWFPTPLIPLKLLIHHICLVCISFTPTTFKYALGEHSEIKYTEILTNFRKHK